MIAGSSTTTQPRRILITLDAVGGVWRYSLDLAAQLVEQGWEVILAGFGPSPDEVQASEARAIGPLVWLKGPLDWMAGHPDDLRLVGQELDRLADDFDVDLLHLNLPSQAAFVSTDRPILTVSHSCVPTWFRAVRRSEPPQDWAWHEAVNRQGFERADLVVAPSASHAEALVETYGPLRSLRVVHNASAARVNLEAKMPYVFAAGRWWDEGKNGGVLDSAAARSQWPVLMAGSWDGPSGQTIPCHHAQALGPLPHEETLGRAAQAAIFVSPSLYEPFGLSVLEAARAGAALVLSDIPIYRELWDGVALFADPREPGELAAAINCLAKSAPQRRDLGRKARERSLPFSVEKQASEIALLYRDLIPARLEGPFLLPQRGS